MYNDLWRWDFYTTFKNCLKFRADIWLYRTLFFYTVQLISYILRKESFFTKPKLVKSNLCQFKYHFFKSLYNLLKMMTARDKKYCNENLTLSITWIKMNYKSQYISCNKERRPYILMSIKNTTVANIFVLCS